MRATKFTDDEFNALNAWLRASDNLARLELDVMDRVAPRIARGVDGTSFSDDDCQALRATADELEVAVANVAASLTRPRRRSVGCLPPTNVTLVQIEPPARYSDGR